LPPPTTTLSRVCRRVARPRACVSQSQVCDHGVGPARPRRNGARQPRHPAPTTAATTACSHLRAASAASAAPSAALAHCHSSSGAASCPPSQRPAATRPLLYVRRPVPDMSPPAHSPSYVPPCRHRHVSRAAVLPVAHVRLLLLTGQVRGGHTPSTTPASHSSHNNNRHTFGK
jgi:hypothetical protein